MSDFFNAVIDISHHNSNTDFPRAKADGVIAVIQKATQGLGGIDPTYVDRRDRIKAAGLMFGAYHFGTGSEGVAQAEHFLQTVGDDPDALLILDFEPNLTGPSMSLVEARAFVTHIKDATGRFPGIYTGHYIKELLGDHRDEVLGQCWLWLAQYGPTAVVPTNWSTWTMWQYTDGALGPEPHSVAGIGLCDRNRFQGTEAQLRAHWAGTI